MKERKRKMKDELTFFMPMRKVPTTTLQMKHVRVVNGKPIFYEPEDLKNARALLTALLAPHKPDKKFTGTIRLTTKWIFPITGKYADGEYKTTKPDTDNLIKLLKDCMTRLNFWNDDAQVASEITEKFYGEKTGIFVKVEKL